jgi:hypothetical protein
VLVLRETTAVDGRRRRSEVRLEKAEKERRKKTHDFVSARREQPPLQQA